MVKISHEQLTNRSTKTEKVLLISQHFGYPGLQYNCSFKTKELEMIFRFERIIMIFFFIGENFCAANFLFTENHDVYLLEYFHSLGMVLSFGFATFALIEGIDRYATHFTEPDKKCSLTSFCRRCIRYESVTCGLQSFLIFVGINPHRDFSLACIYRCFILH